MPILYVVLIIHVTIQLPIAIKAASISLLVSRDPIIADLCKKRVKSI